MSCFIVPTDTIDRIISTIELQGGWAHQAANLPTAFLFDWNALGRAMLALNADAFRERYGDRVANDNPDDRDSYVWEGRHVTLVEGYKSLRCYLYQCTEGAVPDQPLYEALSASADALAVTLVERMPAYQAADWA
jgi:hypothetical protein